MVKDMVTTISVSHETLAVWRELADRSRIDLGKIMEDIAKELKPLLDEADESERVSFLVARIPKKQHVMIAVLPIMVSSFDTPTSDSDAKVDSEVRKRLRKE
jgi:hypothetical protein